MAQTKTYFYVLFCIINIFLISISEEKNSLEKSFQNSQQEKLNSMEASSLNTNKNSTEQSNNNNINLRMLAVQNKITLIINGTKNNVRIINDAYEPDHVYINDDMNDLGNAIIVNLTLEGPNTITIVWDSTLKKSNTMFKNIDYIISADLSHFDASSISTMTEMFYNCSSLEYINLTNFDTSKCKIMSNLFGRCSSLKSLDLSSFNTELVTNMQLMFSYCNQLKVLDLSSFNTQSVTNMQGMFSYCNQLKTLDLSSFNTQSVTNMKNMFSFCDNLKYLDLTHFDTSACKTMNNMFSNCTSLSYLNLTSFDTSIVSDMVGMFKNCASLGELYIRHFKTSEVNNMNDMFSGCGSLTVLEIGETFGTSLVTNMKSMFKDCSSLSSLDLSSFNTSLVTNMEMMFYGCTSLTSLNLSNFHTNSLNTMHHLFNGCQSLKFLDISNFNTSSIKNFMYLFKNCLSLTSLDLSSFETSSVSNMNYMFANCTSLVSLNLANFKTTSLETILFAFINCYSLVSIDISNFDTSLVTAMNSMFSNCSSLVSVDLSSFRTSNVKNMSYMFDNCKNLSFISLSNFNITSKINTKNMFRNCSSLKSADLTNFFCNDINSLFPNLSAIQIIIRSYDDIIPTTNVVANPSSVIYINKETLLLNSYKIEKNNITSYITDKPIENNQEIKISYFDDNQGIKNTSSEINNEINETKSLNNQGIKNTSSEINNEIIETNSETNPESSRRTKTSNSEINNEIKLTNSEINQEIKISNKDNNQEIENIQTDINQDIRVTNTTSELIKKIEVIEVNEYKNVSIKEMVNNLDELILDKDPGKSYKIKGKDYQIYIKPINAIIEDSSVNIYLNECEEKLKEKNPTKSYTLMQVNLKNNKTNCLVDQVEYKIYDENKEPVDLSICEDVDIKIEYKIQNTSLINMQQVKSFNDKGIDVFNINDTFFNDICYPFTDGDSNSDMILSDRVSDIYQNYSICGDNCQYDSFNIEKSSANCNCKIKKEVNTETEEGNFENSITSAFFDSNFGVIKCFNLVFSFEGKLNNYGFWIFGLFIIFHIPTYIFTFINGINPIQSYIKNEMKNKGYTIKDKDDLEYPKVESKKDILSNIKETIAEEDENYNAPPKRKKSILRLNKKRKSEINRIKDSDSDKDSKFKSIDDGDIKNNYPNIKKLDFKIENFNKKRNSVKHEEFKSKKLLTKTNLDTLITESEITKNKRSKRKSVSNKINNKFKNMLHNFNTISIKGSERKNLNEIDEKEKENGKDIIKNKKNDREFPLILINANNSGKKEILKSNHKLDIYNYDEAIAYEKRSFFRIFFIFLISKDNLLNIIFFNPPLELKPLRICIFIFNYAIDLALNALFYLSKNISDKYHYTGPNRIFFSLINNLTKTLVSTIVGYLLLILFSSLSQSSDSIVQIFRDQEELLKKDKNYKVEDNTIIKIGNDIKKILKCLKIKIICFTILELLFVLFFFYYVTAFCQVYQNTQVSWLLDSLSSYLMSFLITLVLSFILTCLYKISIFYKINIMYKISIFLY